MSASKDGIFIASVRRRGPRPAEVTVIVSGLIQPRSRNMQMTVRSLWFSEQDEVDKPKTKLASPLPRCLERRASSSWQTKHMGHPKLSLSASFSNDAEVKGV